MAGHDISEKSHHIFEIIQEHTTSSWFNHVRTPSGVYGAGLICKKGVI
jgi:hypothetical protein